MCHIRSGPRPVARKDIHFATVESNQRDVEAWTMEQYMAKNARLEEWKSRDDKELGGIEGHQLMNRFDDHDVTNNYDSDSDLETCEPVVFAHMPTEVIDMKVLLQHRQLTRFMAANMPAGINS
uniref:Uncharacterized protein n=2 Tax=Physcomitrium patens TaxID=3218 RepID=A0A7I4ECI0_PHYPA